MQTCRRVRPALPKDSPTAPAYVTDLDARENFRMKSIDNSVNVDPSMIKINPGIRPNCFTTAGRAMIPAPTMVLDRLKTAPENDAPSNPASTGSWWSYFSGSKSFLGLRRYLRSAETSIVIPPRDLDDVCRGIWRKLGGSRRRKICRCRWSCVRKITIIEE